MSTRTPPAPAEILAARKDAGLTQTEAASMVDVTLRAWQRWEAAVESQQNRPMRRSLFEFFLMEVAKLRAFDEAQ